MFENRPVARLLIVAMIAIILSGLYLAKATSTEFFLKNQGISNEPLLVYGEKYSKNFANDDVLRYTPVPYTYSHKALMSYLWNNPAQAEAKYEAWLGFLVIISVVSFYLLFFHLSGRFAWSLGLSVAAVVGYFENWWLFSFMGIAGYDSLVGRANYTALIPLYLLLFLKTLRQPYGSIGFFFLLGCGVNLYPAIAILSAVIYYIVMVLHNREGIKPAEYFYPMLAFLLPAIPFIAISLSDIAAFKAAHLADPRHFQFIDRMNLVLNGSANQYRELEWSKLFTHPQGNVANLFKQFIIYPPFLILFGFTAMAGLLGRPQEKKPANSNELILIQLFCGAIALLLAGWVVKALNLDQISIFHYLPPLQYIGNFLIVIGYAVIATQFVNISNAEVSLRQSWIWIAIIVFSFISIVGYFYSGTHSFFSDASYWVVFNGILLLALHKKFGHIPPVYLLVLIILAVASGFSYSYHEIATPQVTYKYLSRAMPVVFSLVFVALIVVSLRQGRKNLYIYALLLIVPFSWALPVRIYDGTADLVNNKGDDEMRSALSEFKNMAEWVGRNTSVDSKFMLKNSFDGDSSNDLGLVSAFKYLAIRSTPPIAGGDYYYYGDLGRRYGARNADIYAKALRSNDDAAILRLSSEIGLDYFIVNVLDGAYSSNNFTKVYDGKYFDVYKVNS